MLTTAFLQSSGEKLSECFADVTLGCTNAMLSRYDFQSGAVKTLFCRLIFDFRWRLSKPNPLQVLQDFQLNSLVRQFTYVHSATLVYVVLYPFCRYDSMHRKYSIGLTVSTYIHSLPNTGSETRLSADG